MIPEKKIIESVNDFNQDRNRSFAEFIAVVFKDKLIEVYLGDSYEEVSTEQISTSYPAVFCGKVVTAYRECLILSSVYVDHDKKIQFGNLIFINERAIRALGEVDGNGVLEDIFLRSRESLDIQKAFTHEKNK